MTSFAEKEPSATFLTVLLLAIQAADDDANYGMKNKLEEMYKSLTEPVVINQVITE